MSMKHGNQRSLISLESFDAYLILNWVIQKICDRNNVFLLGIKEKSINSVDAKMRGKLSGSAVICRDIQNLDGFIN